MLISGSPSPAVRAAAAVAAAVAADEAAKKSYSLGLNMIKDTPAERFPGSNTGFVNPYRTNESYCWEADAPSGRRDSHFVETFPISSMSSNQSGVKRIDGSNSRVSTIDLGTSMHSKARSVQSPYTSAYGTPASSYSLSPSSLGTTAHTDGSYGMRATDLYHTGGQSVYSGSTTHEYPHIDSKPRLINLIPPAMATQKVAPCFQELQEVMLKGVDTRIKLSTAKPLHPGDPLYEVACPMGAAPILFDKADNQNPHPSTLLKSGHKVVFAKKLLQYKLYKYVHSLEVPTSAPPKTENAALDPFGDRARDPSRSRDSIDSCNTSGSATPITISNDNNNTINNNINISRINNSSNNNICSETLSVNTVVVLSNYQQYEGDGLEDGGALVDLALEVDCSPLAQYLREKSLTEAHITREKIDIWFRSLFDHIATLCERIERNSGSQAQH